MHKDEFYQNAKRKQRLYQSRQALFNAVMFSYHFQIKGHNKDIIPILAVIWCPHSILFQHHKRLWYCDKTKF